MKNKSLKFKFVDLFAGIGGMRLGLEKCGGLCVMTSEINKDCLTTYKANFRIKKVFKLLPLSKLKNYKVKIFISDDASNDETVNYIERIKKKKCYKKYQF